LVINTEPVYHLLIVYLKLLPGSYLIILRWRPSPRNPDCTNQDVQTSVAGKAIFTVGRVKKAASGKK
jgi:hypothetical protein